LNMTAETVDSLVGIVSPRAAYRRKQYRFAYEALDSHRTRTKRSGLGGTGDSHLTETNLYNLREIHRELMRNNPIVKGLLRMETDQLIGEGPIIQSKTDDKGWNDASETLWAEEMVEKPCDLTGRLNVNECIKNSFFAYRRDGDSAVIFLDDKLQLIEGDQIGTPFGRKKETDLFKVVNGIAFDNNGPLIGYYIGQPSLYGYIKPEDYKKYLAEQVHFIFDPERSSQSRGEPALTSSIKYIDHLTKYVDAELVAAVVNACFVMFISRREPKLPTPYTKGISSTGYDTDNNRLEKLEPGSILYGEEGEDAKGIGNVRPGEVFDPFVNKMLAFIGRPLCIPLMLITLDFSGATFMNARIAYQPAQLKWRIEQKNRVVPLVSKIWRWFITRKIAEKALTQRDDAFRFSVICNRWPYVDPYKESMADKQQLENKTTTRTRIAARQGDDFEDLADEREREEKILEEKGLKEPVLAGVQNDD